MEMGNEGTMVKEAVQYVKNEYDEVNSKIETINEKIHSANIELATIDKKIKSLNDYTDRTGDIFNSYKNSNNNIIEKSLGDAVDNINNKIKELNEQKEELDKKKEKLKNVLMSDDINKNNDYSQNNTLEMQELDRQRIARDIHDTVVQNMTALIRKQEFISRLMDKDMNRAKLEISSSINMMKDNIEELRNIIFDLRPMALDDLGFKAAFFNLCERLKENEPIIFYTEYDGKDDINSVIGINCLRIIRELCINSIKHSECSEINIKVNVTDSMITIKQSDNGIGYDFDKVSNLLGENNKTNKSFGIGIIKERVELMNGKIDYCKDNGSNYVITIPL